MTFIPIWVLYLQTIFNMKRKNLIILAGVSALGIGLSGCAGLGWSVSSDPYGGPDVGVFFNGGPNNPAPPAPNPGPARPAPAGGGPGWPGPW